MDRLLSTDYGNWPDAIRRVSVSPVLEVDVSGAQLCAFVRSKRSGTLWIPPEHLGPVFPKIAVCSWKCFPWLLPARAVNLFPWCSPRMSSILENWVGRGLGCRLRYFPFIDYSDANEYRFSVARGRLTTVRNVTRFNDEQAASGAQNFARQFVDDLDHILIDIAARRRGSGLEFWVVELNPEIKVS